MTDRVQLDGLYMTLLTEVSAKVYVGDMNNELMNVTEFARYVGFSRQTIYTDIKDGILTPATRRGNSFLFTYPIGDAYIKRKRKQAWKPLIISDNTHNGGSGKTFTMSILMTFLAEEGYRVLGMDNDPQGDLGRYFVSKDDVPNFMWEVYRTEKIEPHMVQKTAHKNIDIISATLEFAEKEDQILSKRYREYVLKRALEQSQELLARYHFIFIDNHPALGTVQFNSMVAANAVLIVNDCRKLSKNSPDAVIDAIDHARTQLVGIVMNRFKGGTNESREALNYARSKYGNRVFQTVMPEWENLSIKDRFFEPGDHNDQVNIIHPYVVGQKKDREMIRTLGKEFLERCKQLQPL